ncbi:hypothetical protein OS493_004211 [Desmophyllum pertusum]|uniref:Uncharacterized protein n=1 Tax=Desmophyllum pertusum TaxID=174260 RepID=A0A9X0D4Q0_9CNID|nr:hypothetical protein OS493_004211 [Desmophyllum pertusum]
MEKALNVAKEGRLVLLSAYFLYKSFELHDRAMNLAQWDYKKHRDEFEALEEEMIPVRDLMETQLIPQWKKGNYANTQKTAGELLKRLSRTSTVLAQLVQTIYRDGKKGARRSKVGCVLRCWRCCCLRWLGICW